LIKTIN